MQKYHDEAVLAYQRALEVYTRQDFPREWAETQLLLAGELSSLGYVRSGEESARLLTEGQRALTQALEIITREESPQQWAQAQHLQGLLLIYQAIRIGGQEGGALLGEAERALERALEVFTRGEFPAALGIHTSQLGGALSSQLLDDKS